MIHPKTTSGVYVLTPNKNKVLWISMVNFPSPNLSLEGALHLNFLEA